MLKLAFLLIGPRAFYRKWRLLAGIGLALIVMALAISADLSPLLLAVVRDLVGMVFIANGMVAALSASAAPLKRPARLASAAKSLGPIAVGSLMLGFPLQSDMTLAALLSFGLIFDGCSRITFAFIVRYRNWQATIALGLAENLYALAILAGWPLSAATNVSLCIAIFLGLSGAWLLRFAAHLRTHHDEVAILALPMFCGRGWYDNAPVLVGKKPAPKPEHPLTVRVWTPVGSLDDDPERRLLIDRYIAAVDCKGVISTGHSALQMGPSLYISHYPETEIERSERDFVAMLRGTAENNSRGRFQPSYEAEVAEWCHADGEVAIMNYDPRRLIAFWAGYRQDDTYNVTSRNCSILVATALDAALEGSLDTDMPWLRLGGLLLNPDLWLAAMIRSRAAPMTWTPGLALDYAQAMARVVDAPERAWAERLRAGLRHLRPMAGKTREAKAA